jgi:hypothetical protein
MTSTLPRGPAQQWNARLSLPPTPPEACSSHVTMGVEEGRRTGGVGGGDEDGWLEGYLEVEQRSENLAGDVGILVYEPGYYTPDAAYSTFKAKHPIGMGNRMVQVASAVVLAWVTKRRLLINWNDPEPLTEFLRPCRNSQKSAL